MQPAWVQGRHMTHAFPLTFLQLQRACMRISSCHGPSAFTTKSSSDFGRYLSSLTRRGREGTITLQKRLQSDAIDHPCRYTIFSKTFQGLVNDPI